MAGRDLTDLAREVTSGPPCPRCGFAMEPGYLKLESSGIVRVTWHDPDTGDQAPGSHVADVWTPTQRGTHWLKGFRCPECEYLELGYGKSGLTRDGWREGRPLPPTPPRAAPEPTGTGE